MANDCLVTKLKSVVDNDNLNILGGIKFKVKGSNIRMGIFIAPLVGKEYTLTLLEEGKTFSNPRGYARLIDSKNVVFTDYNNDAITINGADANTLSDVLLKSKYDIREIFQNAHAINLSDLEYSTGMLVLNCSDASCVGNLTSLKNLTNLERVDLSWNQDVTGEINDLSNLTNLTSINVGGVSRKISGSISTFITGQKQAGRTTCSDELIIKQMDYTPCSFGSFSGTYVSGNGVLSWDATKMAITIGTTIYVIGYTAGQIAELETQGKTVVVCD